MRKPLVSCPLKVPAEWRNPSYETGAGFELAAGGLACKPIGDAKNMIRNQQRCDNIRKSLIEYIDSVNTQK